MSDVFISYSSEDRERARTLAGVLEDQGFSVWWDRKIPPGRTYDDVIEEALHGARVVVVLWSATSIVSDWVKTEAAEAARVGALVPALIESVGPPLEFRRIQAADLIGWEGNLERQGLRNLINAIQGIIAQPAEEVPAQPLAAPSTGEPMPPPPPPPPAQGAFGGNRWPLVIGGSVAAVAVLVAVLVVALSGGGNTGDGGNSGDDSGNGGGGGDALSFEEAEAELGALLAGINWTDTPDPLPATLQLPPSRQLPPIPIEEFRQTAIAPASADVTAEIFASVEKSGDGTDGWMVEVANEFNSANVTLADGRTAGITIREIASGNGYAFIAHGGAPDAYSPSNHLWIEMAKEDAPMTPIREQLVSNVAGLVVRSEIVDDLEAQYGPMSASALIDAVVQGQLIFVYTDPYVASTGLNFVTTALWELSGGQEDLMLSSQVEQQFQDFSSHVRFIAAHALQIRDSIESSGDLDVFVMEYQTFVKTDFLSTGWDFIPYGVAHDNPLYAVGNVSDDKLEVLELFAEFAEGSEWTGLAAEYGFNPPAYTSEVPVPSGQTLIEAQHLWKENKDGGQPVTALFVTDVSGSMQGTRIEAVKKALESGIGYINEDNSIGMLTFSDQVTKTLSIRQFDLDQKGRFAGAERDMSVGGGTAMYDAIAVGLQLLLDEKAENPNAKPVMIVLTDGQTADGLRFHEISDVIRALRIPIHTIGFEANVEELQDVSALVEAAFVDAGEADVEYEIAKILNREV